MDNLSQSYLTHGVFAQNNVNRCLVNCNGDNSCPFIPRSECSFLCDHIRVMSLDVMVVHTESSIFTIRVRDRRSCDDIEIPAPVNVLNENATRGNVTNQPVKKSINEFRS